MASGRAWPSFLRSWADVDVDRALVAVPVRPPDAVEQLAPRQGLAPMAGEVDEEVELPAGQGDGLAAPRHLTPLEVDLEGRPDGDHRPVAPLAPTEDGPDPGDHLAGENGLTT